MCKTKIYKKRGKNKKKCKSVKNQLRKPKCLVGASIRGVQKPTLIQTFPQWRQSKPSCKKNKIFNLHNNNKIIICLNRPTILQKKKF